MTAQPFVPREYQGLIVDHILANPRCAVFAGMGTGKTGATYSALDILALVEDGPVLVVAPLRVARTTWPDEARKWSTFRHLRVVPVLGSVKERLAALRYKADVYTTNFENLPWLVEHFAEKWPFRTVVIDEATKLKGFRLRQGTTRAKALGRVAHTLVKRIILLTGTPAPNGLQDLWGQAWFLDKGHRLGRTFDAFRQRWFEKSYDGHSITPRKTAQDEMQRALKDICITIDAKDWFDLREPITTNIYVDLPAKARALYEDMEKRMFMELAGHEVEAFGAAARTIKCIAEGTELLTSNGWKPIEQWQKGDFLWDGVAWVSADRLVCNGYMPVVKCLHVTMTNDHKVLTTDGWKTAEEINNADASERLDRAPVRLPDCIASIRDDRRDASEARHLGCAVRLWGRIRRHRLEPDQRQQGRQEVLRVPPAGDASGRLGQPRHDSAPRVEHLGGDAIALPKPEGQGLAELGRARHIGVRALAAVRKLLGRHGADMDAGADDRAAEQQRELRAGKLHLGGLHGASEQPAWQRALRHATGAHDDSPGREGLRGQARDPAPAHPARLAPGKGIGSARVFDLVNCGPRHRFTVRGDDGVPLIVHNCLQVSQGFAYVGEAKDWVHIHDVKIEALEEIIEEAAGMPVLVAYHFKPDLARLLKAFPKGRALDQDPQTIRDWNAGKIPVMFAHPASAGHGLNLQDGGNILVYFGHWWNLEERMQIFERIGPTRQMQAGHDRAMFCYNIVARDTVDELVMERIATKRDVQDILLDAMKIRGIR